MNQDEIKRLVAQKAISYVLPKLSPDTIIGIGTGSTANAFIDALAEHRDSFAAAVASSEASAQRLLDNDIEVVELNTVDHLPIYIDGADECNHNLELIKGGGAALTREKIIAACADEFICIADGSKWVNALGAFPLPVEVIPMASNFVSREITKLGGKPVLREGVITDNGNHIIDVHNLEINHPKKLEAKLNSIVGVITNGLFAARPADILLLGNPSGVDFIDH